jgi:hypothetical protein
MHNILTINRDINTYDKIEIKMNLIQSFANFKIENKILSKFSFSFICLYL